MALEGASGQDLPVCIGPPTRSAALLSKPGDCSCVSRLRQFSMCRLAAGYELSASVHGAVCACPRKLLTKCRLPTKTQRNITQGRCGSRKRSSFTTAEGTSLQSTVTQSQRHSVATTHQSCIAPRHHASAQLACLLVLCDTSTCKLAGSLRVAHRQMNGDVHSRHVSRLPIFSGLFLANHPGQAEVKGGDQGGPRLGQRAADHRPPITSPSAEHI